MAPLSKKKVKNSWRDRLSQLRSNQVFCFNFSKKFTYKSALIFFSKGFRVIGWDERRTCMFFFSFYETVFCLCLR